ncbi:MAG: carbamoyltransferase HypF [Candidatus Aminicenantes bacterium]|nr:carbamoyltransferase HypF [Candidatus Aminicenantes bacterium]
MTRDLKNNALNISVFGVVQGVGFRPFVYRLAHKHGCRGWVKNIGEGVEIHLESFKPDAIGSFLKELECELPPLAKLERLVTGRASFSGCRGFTIKKTTKGKSFVFISPDISVCPDCLEEMRSSSDRRYRYPFINCTNCGPRYTIVRDLPYDRPQTTMDSFIMCPDCRREYTDPLDRRYHAQPIACPVCGPKIALFRAKPAKKETGGIERAAGLLREGFLVSIKGLGGFHITCDPFNLRSVHRLRSVKKRKRKPLALMARSLDVIERYAWISEEERIHLSDPRRPIVLLKKKKDIPGIAPHIDMMGFMLPYTPLHALLLENIDLIVATSSNPKDAPIIKNDRDEIRNLCDYVLTHDRPIHMRADDSVLKVTMGTPLFIRRARGYVPYPQKMPSFLASKKHILALGGELKDTISIYKNGYAVTSQFLGDLDDYRNFAYFEETVNHLTKLFDIHPDTVVSDLHPDFHTTRYAEKMNIPHLQVQHHYAHVLAVFLEHHLPKNEKALGIIWDGYGYGSDGGAWGGEFLLADYSSYRRLGHFLEVPLPGGDQASRQPWRMAVSYLNAAFGLPLPDVPSLKNISPAKIKGILSMIGREINSPLTSSCGRLFDAVSFLAGTSPLEMEFEAEAPMRFEAQAADHAGKGYPFEIIDKTIPWRISFLPAIRAVVSEYKKKTPICRISAEFHMTLAQAAAAIADKTRKDFNIHTVVLSGGVFLNKKLYEFTASLLENKGFRVLRNVTYSPNDESISLGQIGYALGRLQQEKKHNG